MADEKQEMDLLLAEQERKIGDKRVVVHKISLLDSIRLASHLSVVASNIVENSSLTASALTKITYKDDNDPEQTNGVRMLGIIEMLGVLGDSGAEVVNDLIVKSTNLTDEEVEKIDLEEGVDLLFDIYEVNKDFFTKLSNKLQKKMKKTAATKSTRTKKAQ